MRGREGRLVAEGVFYGFGNDFAPLPPPDDEEVERLLRRVWKLARARYPDGLPYACDAKEALSAASAQTRLHLPLEEDRPAPKRRRCAFFEGYSLHADTWCGENDRQSLERLARYGRSRARRSLGRTLLRARISAGRCRREPCLPRERRLATTPPGSRWTTAKW